jgi:hypothetical protein
VLADLNFTVGDRILEKSKWEHLTNADYTTAIVFAAMAVEAEMARLFFKWRRIELLPIRGHRTSTEDLEPECRKLSSSIAKRIDQIAIMLSDKDLGRFARRSPLAGTIVRDYPSLNLDSLAGDVQQALFWPRNRILHHGFTDHTKDDATRCVNVAALILQLFKSMDLVRSRRREAPTAQPGRSHLAAS